MATFAGKFPTLALEISKVASSSQFGILFLAYNPIEMAYWPGMAHLAALEPPLRQLLAWDMTAEESFDFIWCPRPQTRDVPVINPDKGHNGHQVGKKEMARFPPEVIWRDEHGERPEEADEDERGEMTGLEFEDTANAWLGTVRVCHCGENRRTYQNPSDVSIVFSRTFAARSSSKWWKARLKSLMTFLSLTPAESLRSVSAAGAFVASTLCGM